jgi:predicted NBD/HSP70 family sugar kinase
MFLGIEIGGTKLQLGLGRGDGQLLALWRGAVDAAAGGLAVQAHLMLLGAFLIFAVAFAPWATAAALRISLD